MVSSRDHFGSQALGDVFGFFERGLSRVGSDEEDRLGNPPERRHIDGLSLGRASLADFGRVLSGAAVTDSIDDDLPLVRRVYLDGVFAGEQFDQFHGLTHDPHGLDFFSGVSSVVLQSGQHPLDDGALSLSEFFDLVSAGGVGNVDLHSLALDSDVVLERRVSHFDVVVAPSSEEFHAFLSFSHQSDL